jgi:hypothetical protein
MAQTVKVGAHSYQIGTLNAFQCYDIARKYSTVLLQVAQLKRLRAEAEAAPQVPDSAVPPAPLPPPPGPEEFARVMCMMSRPIPQVDVDIAIKTCLSVVTREQAGGTGWAPVLERGGGLMFNDIDMMAMLVLVWHVMEAHKIPDFFSSPHSKDLLLL